MAAAAFGALNDNKDDARLDNARGNFLEALELADFTQRRT